MPSLSTPTASIGRCAARSASRRCARALRTTRCFGRSRSAILPRPSRLPPARFRPSPITSAMWRLSARLSGRCSKLYRAIIKGTTNSYRQANQLFRNLRNGRFAVVGDKESGFTEARSSRGAVARAPRYVPPPLDLSTGWKVSLGDVGKSVFMDHLRPWTDDEETRFFSGEAAYAKTATVPEILIQPGLEVRLDFGEGDAAARNTSGQPGHAGLVREPGTRVGRHLPSNRLRMFPGCRGFPCGSGCDKSGGSLANLKRNRQANARSTRKTLGRPCGPVRV